MKASSNPFVVGAMICASLSTVASANSNQSDPAAQLKGLISQSSYVKRVAHSIERACGSIEPRIQGFRQYTTLDSDASIQALQNVAEATASTG